jgi:predicted nuclease of predicted toxin-antitoxin system
MRFKIDENLPVEILDLLRRKGHEALSVAEQQLAGHPDTDVASTCQAERRVLVTLDLNFSDIRLYPPED